MGGINFQEAETGLVQKPDAHLTLNSVKSSVMVAFLIEPTAVFTRQGTVGR